MSNPFLGLGFKNSFVTFKRPLLEVIAPVLGPLYDFVSHTFNTGNGSGNVGPTSFSLISSYTSSVWYSNYFSLTDGIQYWTAPSTGNYTIRAAGAAGQSGAPTTRSRGIIIESTIELTKGQQYKILVGQMGRYFQVASDAGSGGGGTFMSTIDNIPVIVAGGGGGGPTGGDGRSVTGGASSGSVSGGNNGGGGGAPTPQSSAFGSGGGGFTGNGTNAWSLSTGGRSFVNGGLGGTGSSGCNGGFGGGGGSWGPSGTGHGGGGGYSGGAGGLASDPGGGGGSYSQTQITTIGYNRSHGYLTITKAH